MPTALSLCKEEQISAGPTATMKRPSISALRSQVDEKAHHAKRAFASWQGFKEWVQVPDTALDQVSNEEPELTCGCASIKSDGMR